jgi:hypothetical protein
VARKQAENLELLASAYGSLVRAGEGSLEAAYAFGQVIEALYGIYTLTQLAAEVGVSNATISKYRKLATAYPNVNALLRRSRELHTYDVGVLASGSVSAPARYELHCTNCGSYAIERERVTSENPVPPVARQLLDVTP